MNEHFTVETQRQEEQYGRAAQAPPKFLSSTPVCDVGAFWYPQGNLVPPTRQVPTTVTRWPTQGNPRQPDPSATDEAHTTSKPTMTN
ncbi:hypothetical protein T4E_12281 [Trichinella pseudospiralis]|uniref:Uncharacterized protein n=1 Tax=Trichinella pseudospiralis TaxID=6337 RepID=A0A0V0YME6_TRIPS|nr:hypothetical protein T4E_12281 [Trichinella pseudospiralis]